MERKKIAVLGQGDQAHVLKDLIDLLPEYLFSGFIEKEKKSETRYSDENLTKLKQDEIIHIANGVGNFSYPWMEPLIKKYLNHGFIFPVLIHPSAIIAPTVTLGQGTLVMEGAIIKSHAKIHDFCLINSGALISHHCVIHSQSHISLRASLAGNCSIGKNVFIGMNASVIERKTIGHDTIIGAGALVLKDIEPHVIAVGSPARIHKYRDTRHASYVK